MNEVFSSKCLLSEVIRVITYNRVNYDDKLNSLCSPINPNVGQSFLTQHSRDKIYNFTFRDQNKFARAVIEEDETSYFIRFNTNYYATFSPIFDTLRKMSDTARGDFDDAYSFSGWCVSNDNHPSLRGLDSIDVTIRGISQSSIDRMLSPNTNCDILLELHFKE